MSHSHGPSLPPPRRPHPSEVIQPGDLWPRLNAPQLQAVQQLLSELLVRRLRPRRRKEVTDEPR